MTGVEDNIAEDDWFSTWTSVGRRKEEEAGSQTASWNRVSTPCLNGNNELMLDFWKAFTANVEKQEHKVSYRA